MDSPTTLLNNVIAVVEEHGFDALTYDNGHQGCYIGLMRKAAGLKADPQSLSSVAEAPGSSLATALTAIDRAALPRLIAMPYLDARSIRRDPGRIAERYGGQLVRTATISVSDQAPIALEVLREARAKLGDAPVVKPSFVKRVRDLMPV